MAWLAQVLNCTSQERCRAPASLTKVSPLTSNGLVLSPLLVTAGAAPPRSPVNVCRLSARRLKLTIRADATASRRGRTVTGLMMSSDVSGSLLNCRWYVYILLFLFAFFLLNALASNGVNVEKKNVSNQRIEGLDMRNKKSDQPLRTIIKGNNYNRERET